LEFKLRVADECKGQFKIQLGLIYV
jgi:hypothetical protein